MILPGTYQNGFAPRDGSPLYPELWRGCVGAWNPGLGPTGLTLRDWSGYGNHGTLTNITAQNCWKISEGRHAMEFVSSTDQSVQISSAQNQLSLPPKSFWISTWARPTASGGAAGREVGAGERVERRLAAPWRLLGGTALVAGPRAATV
jgi:hypothetical protein